MMGNNSDVILSIQAIETQTKAALPKPVRDYLNNYEGEIYIEYILDFIANNYHLAKAFCNLCDKYKNSCHKQKTLNIIIASIHLIDDIMRDDAITAINDLTALGTFKAIAIGRAICTLKDYNYEHNLEDYVTNGKVDFEAILEYARIISIRMNSESYY